MISDAEKWQELRELREQLAVDSSPGVALLGDRELDGEHGVGLFLQY